MRDLSVPQGPEGRPPNVSPAQTLLPRGAGWRIALYAVFRKENRTRGPLQRGQGGKQGAGLGDRYKTLRSAGGAPLHSSEDVFGIKRCRTSGARTLGNLCPSPP